MTLAGRRRHAQARSMLGCATHHGKFYGDGNLHDSETVSGFRRGVVRATILHGAIRASDFLTGVSASSTAAAVRDGIRVCGERSRELKPSLSPAKR
jgi:hypothetical protein